MPGGCAGISCWLLMMATTTHLLPLSLQALPRLLPNTFKALDKCNKSPGKEGKAAPSPRELLPRARTGSRTATVLL